MRTFIVKVFILALVMASFLVTATPQKVKVVQAKLETKNLVIELSGNVQAMNDAQLASLESGVVKAIKVEAGDHVTVGQVLLELDDSLAKIELMQAKALYQAAEVSYQEDLRLYNEITGLAKKQVVAKTLLAQRRSQVANSKAIMSQAAAKVALQQEIVTRHKLTAPFSGTIALRNVDVGEWVSQQNKVLQLVSDDTLRVFVDIPQEYFGAIKNGAAIDALVIPDTSAEPAIKLTLSKYINVSNAISRTFKARIDLPADTQLVSGMSAKVQVILPAESASQVNLPKTALKRHPDGSYSVYAVENNKVKRFSVKLLKTGFDNVFVQGVPENTDIIVSGNDLLIENTQVEIITSKGAL